jgi:hypothetical protein
MKGLEQRHTQLPNAWGRGPTTLLLPPPTHLRMHPRRCVCVCVCGGVEFDCGQGDCVCVCVVCVRAHLRVRECMDLLNCCQV